MADAAVEGGRAGAAPRSAAMVAVTILLVSVTMLQRFGLNLGSYSLNAALPAMYGLLIVAAFTRVLAVSMARVILFAIGAAIALVSTMINEEQSSVSSLLLLLAMYLPLVFVLTPDSRVTRDTVLRAFLNVTLLCALAGIVQFYGQFVIHGEWWFDFTASVPSWLRGPSGFNTVIPVGSLFKSNGFFFREPSGFSFMMALALMTECLSLRRVGRIMCFALALLLTYSGTGLLALLIGMLIPMNRKTILWLALAALVGGTLVWLLDDLLNLSFTLGRLNEFDSERSSAYIRYIAPARLIADATSAHPVTLWFGHGPGTIFRNDVGYEFHDPTWAKLIFEYGVLGFVAFVTLFLGGLRRPLAALRVRVMLFAGWLVMGGHLLSPEQCFLTFALVGLLPDAPARGALPAFISVSAWDSPSGTFEPAFDSTPASMALRSSGGLT